MPLVQAFRCSHSGLYFPGDYVKQWGRKYGIGLGSQPVSEILNTQDHMEISRNLDRPNLSMKPMEVTKAQIDYVEIEQADYDANKAVIALDDPDYAIRSQIVRQKQKDKGVIP